MTNLLGRGERFQVDYSYGSKRSSNVNMSLSKPIHSLGYKESSMPNTYSIPTVTTSGKVLWLILSLKNHTNLTFLTFEHLASQALKTQNQQLSITHPASRGWLEKRIFFVAWSLLTLSLTLNIPSGFQHSAEFLPSGYKELLRGFLVDFSFLSAPQVYILNCLSIFTYRKTDSFLVLIR